MAGLPEVIGLLYRADWTRLSLSAELRSENDRELSRLSSEAWSHWDHGWPEQKQDDGRYVAGETLDDAAALLARVVHQPLAHQLLDGELHAHPLQHVGLA